MKYLQQFVTTSLNVGGGIDASQTTGIVLQSLNNIDATKPSVACISWADPLSTSVAEWVTYTSINSTTNELNGVTRGAEGYSAKTHSNGAVVAFPLSKAHVNELNVALAVEHNDDGTHKDITAASINVDDSTTFSNVFTSSLSRQAIINGNFDVWQRGVTSTVTDASATFIADHWYYFHRAGAGGTLPTLTTTREILTSGDIPNAFYYWRLTTNGAGTSLGTNALGQIAIQKIEYGTRFLCGDGKKVTLSFYARSSIANKKLGIYATQNYGTTGSPTSDETIAGTNFTLTSTWTKYTHTFTTNTLASKTFGTSNNDYLQLYFLAMWADAYKANVGAASSETYVGSGTIDIAQVQLCAGDVALPFMPKSFEEELRACQRYCYAITTSSAQEVVAFGMNAATNTAYCMITNPVVMRIEPTLTATAGDWKVYEIGGSSYDVTSIAVDDVNMSSPNMTVLRAETAGSLTQFRSSYLVGDGTTGRVLILSAEL